MLLERPRTGCRQLGPVQTALAVHVRGDMEVAHERAVRAGRHGDVAPPHELEDAQGVVGRLVERLVAVHRRDAEQLHLRARERKEERDRVVVAGVAVEDELHVPSISSSSAVVGRDG